MRCSSMTTIAPAVEIGTDGVQVREEERSDRGGSPPLLPAEQQHRWRRRIGRSEEIAEIGVAGHQNPVLGVSERHDLVVARPTHAEGPNVNRVVTGAAQVLDKFG